MMMVVFFLEAGMFTRDIRGLRGSNLVKNLNIVDIIAPFYKFACFTTKGSGSLEQEILFNACKRYLFSNLLCIFQPSIPFNFL